MQPAQKKTLLIGPKKHYTMLNKAENNKYRIQSATTKRTFNATSVYDESKLTNHVNENCESMRSSGISFYRGNDLACSNIINNYRSNSNSKALLHPNSSLKSVFNSTGGA